jgi:hypothetical protein
MVSSSQTMDVSKKTAYKNPYSGVKKVLEIVPDGKGLYELKFTGGGEVPGPLKGKYTSHYFAQKDIMKYSPKASNG